MLSKYFTASDREMICNMHERGHTLKEIAVALGREALVVDNYARYGLGINLHECRNPDGAAALQRRSVRRGVGRRCS